MPSRNVADTNDKLVMAEKVLSSLANLDAMKIFNEALNGIESSTKTIKKLGLSQKRYYTRLNELIEAGLIKKNGEIYELTILGKICHTWQETFLEILEKRERLDLMDRLKLSKNLSLEESEEISRILAKDLVDTFNITDILSYVKVADTWEKVVRHTIEILENAEKNIYFVTKYVEMRVVEILIKKYQKGVKMYLLSDNAESFSDKFRMIVMMLSNPKMVKYFFDFFSSDEINFKLVEDVPYTFIVVDEKYVMIEIANPINNKFLVAFFFKNEKIAKRLLETFDKLWDKAKEIKELLPKIPSKILRIKGK
ncbi:MAG: DUF7436 family protein [Candidatus Njordarchaeales archaeon]